MEPNLTAILAVAQNGVIGVNNDLPWHIGEDLKRFKKLTVGHTIIMGRKTFESFKSGPLPNRRHIILTKNSSYRVKDCFVVNTIDELIKICDTSTENFIIGGAEIYSLLLPYTSKILLTRIYKNFEGDAFFPDLSVQQWEKASESELFTDEKSRLTYQYLDYQRVE